MAITNNHYSPYTGDDVDKAVSSVEAIQDLPTIQSLVNSEGRIYVSGTAMAYVSDVTGAGFVTSQVASRIASSVASGTISGAIISGDAIYTVVSGEVVSGALVVDAATAGLHIIPAEGGEVHINATPQGAEMSYGDTVLKVASAITVNGDEVATKSYTEGVASSAASTIAAETVSGALLEYVTSEGATQIASDVTIDTLTGGGYVDSAYVDNAIASIPTVSGALTSGSAIHTTVGVTNFVLDDDRFMVTIDTEDLGRSTLDINSQAILLHTDGAGIFEGNDIYFQCASLDIYADNVHIGGETIATEPWVVARCVSSEGAAEIASNVVVGVVNPVSTGLQSQLTAVSGSVAALPTSANVSQIASTVVAAGNYVNSDGARTIASAVVNSGGYVDAVGASAAASNVANPISTGLQNQLTAVSGSVAALPTSANVSQIASTVVAAGSYVDSTGARTIASAVVTSGGYIDAAGASTAASNVIEPISTGLQNQLTAVSGSVTALPTSANVSQIASNIVSNNALLKDSAWTTTVGEYELAFGSGGFAIQLPDAQEIYWDHCLAVDQNSFRAIAFTGDGQIPTFLTFTADMFKIDYGGQGAETGFWYDGFDFVLSGLNHNTLRFADSSGLTLNDDPVLASGAMLTAISSAGYATSGAVTSIVSGALVASALPKDQPFSTTAGGYTIELTNGGVAVAYMDEDLGTSAYIGISYGGLDISYGETGEASIQLGGGGDITISAEGTITANGSAITQVTSEVSGSSLSLDTVQGGVRYICQDPLEELTITSIEAGCNVEIRFDVATSAPVLTLPPGIAYIGVEPDDTTSHYVMVIDERTIVCNPYTLTTSSGESA